MTRSAIMREDTAGLAVVRPQALQLGEDVTTSERERAIEEGRSVGYADGLARARAQLQADAGQARSTQESAARALSAAIAEAERVLALERQRLEHAAIELAFDIAKAVLVRELGSSSSPGVDAIKRALAESPVRDEVVVRLNPADAEALYEEPPIEGVAKIIADPAISPGGCILEIGAALVDAQIDTALERVRKVLDEATGRS